mmetsp:Transcript_97472/g.225965  ORF Transcript_97472/g.225965 Transcript_97472/m.225965 type:complete len:215 (-) Transcript_97472:515-1159(-)
MALPVLARVVLACWCGHLAQCRSMMEEPQVREGHGHAVGVARRDHLLVGHGAAGLGHKAYADPGAGVDGVAEGEEGVRGDGDALEALQELRLLLRSQGPRHRVKALLPQLALGLVHVALDVAHAGIHSLLPLRAGLERQGHDLGVEAQPPSRGLARRKLDAVHSALLPGTHSDHHAALRITHGVGLRVLDGDGSQDKVQLGLLWQLVLLRLELV